MDGGHHSVHSKRMEFDSSVAAIRQGKFMKVNRINVRNHQGDASAEGGAVSVVTGGDKCLIRKHRN